MIPFKYYYLAIDLGVLLFPFLFSFYSKMPFYKYWKALGVGILAMMIVFIPWDIYFTSEGIWGFNEKYLTGIKLINLPIEEWLFFICIPYACIFTYESFNYLFPKVNERWNGKKWSGFYILILIPILFVNFTHWYTATTAVLTIVALGILIGLKFKKLGLLHFSWIVLLVPFYLSNGVLTGINFTQYHFINMYPDQVSDMIVWYNNSHNLGIRIWSVPLDDFFYGMLMLLISIPVYEWSKKRFMAA
ncbi:MAG: lycopene cyclase domain-containing protein [Flavobacteriales bacterium]